MSRPKAWDGTGSPPIWDSVILLHGPLLLGDVALPRAADKFLDLLRGWSREGVMCEEER